VYTNYKTKDLIYKVNDKTFAILSEEIYPHIILKNEPLLNKALRKKFNFIFPTSNILNKTYWNTIILLNDLTDPVIFNMIDKSYDLTIEKMTKKQKQYYNYAMDQFLIF
jgi:predicted DNA-binding protein (MmcQ/YjbR family)